MRKTEQVLLQEKYKAFLEIRDNEVRLDIFLPAGTTDVEPGPLKDWLNDNTKLDHSTNESECNGPRVTYLLLNIKTLNIIFAADKIREAGLGLMPAYW